MKRVLSTLLLVLALVPLLLLMRWSGEGKSAWTPAADGVRMRLASPRFVYRAGEDIQVMLRFRKSGGRPHVAAGDRPILVVLRHEGRELGRIDVTLAGPHEIAVGDDDATVEIPGRLQLSDGPGIYQVAARYGDVHLRPMKLRVLKAKGTPAAPAPAATGAPAAR